LGPKVFIGRPISSSSSGTSARLICAQNNRGEHPLEVRANQASKRARSPLHPSGRWAPPTCVAAAWARTFTRTAAARATGLAANACIVRPGVIQ